jgi:hypothetical protein
VASSFASISTNSAAGSLRDSPTPWPAHSDISPAWPDFPAACRIGAVNAF